MKKLYIVLEGYLEDSGSCHAGVGRLLVGCGVAV